MNFKNTLLRCNFMLLCRITVRLALVAALGILAMVAAGQEPNRSSTPWQEQTQKKLNELGTKAAFRNKSFTLVIPEGEYEFVSLSIPKNVSLIASPTTTRSVRLRYVGPGDSTLVTLQGYGARFSGCDMLAKDPQAPRLVGIRVEDALNAEVDRVRFAHYGVDSQGIVIAGRESITVQKCEFRCAVPVTYAWGDNVVFRDLDIGGATTAESRASLHATTPSTCVWIQGMPDQVVFDGSQTWQGGDHALFGEIDRPRTGQGLNIYNLRYEQSLSREDPQKAAVHLRFADRGLENLLIVGSRWTDRKAALHTNAIQQITLLGSRLPGSGKPAK